MEKWDVIIEEIERALGRKAQKEFLDLQPGDVPATYADVDDLIADVGFQALDTCEMIQTDGIRPDTGFKKKEQ